MRRLPSLRFSIHMSVVCDKGKGRPLGQLKATFSTALKLLQCSKTIMSYDQSQCVLLALCVCALARGLTEKVLGLGQRRGGCAPPPLIQPPKLSNTPRGHTLAGGRPRGNPTHAPRGCACAGECRGMQGGVPCQRTAIRRFRYRDVPFVWVPMEKPLVNFDETILDFLVKAVRSQEHTALPAPPKALCK